LYTGSPAWIIIIPISLWTERTGPVTISLFVLIFCSALGILAILYCFHFRYRALVMGPERLKSALSRTISGEEDASDEDLREGLKELESRLRRGIILTSLALAVVLAACIILTASSTLPLLTMALAGVCILLVGVLSSLMLLRDIPRLLERYLEKAAGDIESGV